MQRKRVLFVWFLVGIMAAPVPAGAFDLALPSHQERDRVHRSEHAKGARTRRSPSARRSQADGKSAGLAPYRDLGAWIDMFDRRPWAHPGKTVRAMARRGVTTVYLETSNYSKKRDLYRPGAIARLIRSAHAREMAIVSWYVPGFKNLKKDLRRAMKAIRFKTDDGQGFDSFALDIEATVVRDIGTRNRRFSALARRIRNRVGNAYTLGAIVPEAGALYWPNFPYQEVARRFDVFLPMAYYTYRVKGRFAVRRFIVNNVTTIRQRTGKPGVPIHPIGGIGGEGTRAEAEGYVAAVIKSGAMGGSFYDFPITTDGEWAALRRLAR